LPELSIMPESPPASSIPSQGPGAFRLSEELVKLEEKSREQSINLGDVIFLLDERAHTFLLLLLSLPFVQPIPLPGLSTPFGVAIAFLGISFLVGQKPWLPRRLLKMQLPETFLAPALRGMRRPVCIMEALLRPRILFLTTNLSMQRLEGLCILVCGVLLSLPLPIPFSNMLPAMTVIAFACSTLGKDGFFYVGGIFCFAITVVFFFLIGFGGAAAMAWIYEWLAENIFAE
jgi:hypothetical protein